MSEFLKTIESINQPQICLTEGVCRGALVRVVQTYLPKLFFKNTVTTSLNQCYILKRVLQNLRIKAQACPGL